MAAEVIASGDVTAELTRRGFVRTSAEAAPASEPEAVHALHLSGGAVAQALVLLDRVGNLLVDLSDHARDTGQGLIIDALRAAEAVEALLRGTEPGDAT